jgi:S1-C subfamily serine protease
MTGVKTIIAAAAVVAGVAGVGAAVVPADREPAQAATVRQAPRAVHIASSHGGRLGVTIAEVDDQAVQRAKLPAPGGVVVEEVSGESPAETAGFKAGDVIVEFDGERVRGTRQFARLVQETPGGRAVQATVMRDGQRLSLSVTPRESGTFQYFGDLGDLVDGVRSWVPAAPVPPVPPAPPAPPALEAPRAPRAPQPPVPPPMSRFFDFEEMLGGGSGRLGVRVSALETQLGDYFGTREGVLVTSVESDSPAGRAGVKAGDVIVSVNGTRVSSPAALRTASLRLEANEDFTLEIVRNKATSTLKGRTDEAARRRTRTVL